MTMTLTDHELLEVFGLLDEPDLHRKGKGAQALARTDGPYVLQCNPRDGGGFFVGYKTHEGRARAAASFIAQGYDVNERVDGSKPCRAFLDIDAPPSAADEELTLIAGAFHNALEYLTGATPVLNEFGYDGAKRSRHIVSDVVLEDGKAVAAVASATKRYLPAEIAAWIDSIGNSKSFGLRLPYSAKAGDATRRLLPLFGSDPDGYWLQEDISIDVTDTAAEVAIEAPAEEAPAALNGNASILATRIRTEFPWFDAPVVTVVEDRPDIVATCERNAPHACESCGREHDRKNAYIRVDEDGVARLHCFGAPKGSKPLAVCMDSPPVIPIDGFDVLEEATHVDGKFNDLVIEDDGISDLYIGSAWGTGKSHHNGLIIRALLARKPTARVLIVSARRSLSAQMCADLKAVSYTQVKGILDTKAVPVSVWQLESLKRVRCEEVFDLLLIDELTALAAHAYQRDGNGSARAGISTLRMLAKQALRTIVSDNDLTGEQVSAFKALREAAPALVYRNDYQPWAGIPARIYNGHKANEHLQAALWARLDGQYAARESAGSWNGTIVAVHSRKTADTIAIEARRRYGNALVKLYTGESCDYEKRKDFSDAATAWAGALVVIYTGTVSVGVSCNIAHFDEVYALFVSGNASAATSAQMLFRARQVKRINIAFTGRRVFGLPTSREKLLSWSTLAQNRENIPDAFRHDRCPSISEPTASNPTALDKIVSGFEGRLWVNAMLESTRSQTDFVGRLSSILSRAGLVVTLENDAPPVVVTAPTPESKEAPAPTREEVMVAEVPEAIDRACHGVDTERDRTYGEKAGDRALLLAKNYNVDVREITPEWVVEYEPHVEAYCRLSRFIKGISRTGDALKVTSEAEGVDLAKRTLEAMNIDLMTMDGEQTVSADTLKTAAEAMGGEINKSSLRLYGDTHGARRSKAASNFRAWRGVLAVPLSFIGLAMEQTYRTQRDENRGSNPIGVKLRYRWAATALTPRPPYPALNHGATPKGSSSHEHDYDFSVEDLTCLVEP